MTDRQTTGCSGRCPLLNPRLTIMPLPHADPRWNQLLGSYGDTEDIVAWLSEAYEQGGFSDEWGLGVRLARWHDLATRPYEDNLVLALVREYPDETGHALVNVVLNACVNLHGTPMLQRRL